MNGADAIAEVATTFPARGLNVAEHHPGRSPIFGFERICAQCGKAFLSYPEHVYKHSAPRDDGSHKRHDKYFCTYGCMRAWERAKTAKRGRRS